MRWPRRVGRCCNHLLQNALDGLEVFDAATGHLHYQLRFSKQTHVAREVETTLLQIQLQVAALSAD